MIQHADLVATMYAEALLITFNVKVKSKIPAMKFNRDDVFEVLTGKSVGNISPELLDDLPPGHWSEATPYQRKAALALTEAIKVQNEAQRFLPKFMEMVSDALTAIDLCDKHGRELVVFEVEDADWMAVDLRTIESADADF